MKWEVKNENAGKIFCYPSTRPLKGTGWQIHIGKTNTKSLKYNFVKSENAGKDIPRKVKMVGGGKSFWYSAFRRLQGSGWGLAGWQAIWRRIWITMERRWLASSPQPNILVFVFVFVLSHLKLKWSHTVYKIKCSMLLPPLKRYLQIWTRWILISKPTPDLPLTVLNL